MTGRAVTVLAGGDIMLGEHPIMVGRGMCSALEDGRVPDPFAGISARLRAVDLAIANLECALADRPRRGAPEVRECVGPAAGVALLAEAGFDALNVANNHTEQHGREAFLLTVDALEAAGIAVVGLAEAAPGRCRPVDLERAGVPLRLLGWSLRPRQHFTRRPLYAEGDRQGMIADVREGVAAGRVVVASIHWGDEFVPIPSRAQQELGRALVTAGATLVLGHHPHVLQGWERHGSGAIIYSLGNLVFDMPWLPELRRTALWRCRLDGTGVRDPAWEPLLADAEHRPRPAPPEVAAGILDFLATARRGLETGEGPFAVPDDEEYDLSVRRGLSRNRRASQRYFLRHAWRYEPRVLMGVAGRYLGRRLGLVKD